MGFTDLNLSTVNLAAFACFCIPAAADYVATMTLVTTALGLGSGVISFMKDQTRKALEAQQETTIFNLVAEENALHRRVWAALQKYVLTPPAQEDIEELLRAAQKSQDHSLFARFWWMFPELDTYELDPIGDGSAAHLMAVKGYFDTANELMKIYAGKA